MKKVVELSNEEARKYFLKGSSYFSDDLPLYISFEPILTDVSAMLNGKSYKDFQHDAIRPYNLSSVNYKFFTNKDGRFAWRPYELIHPAIYVSLVNELCNIDNWNKIQNRLSEFQGGAVECCSEPVLAVNDQKDTATQIQNWWLKVEQQSLKYSLMFSHVLHTDVTDCYGALYTHSIPWAIHGLKEAKENRESSLFGNQIDKYIRAGRHGQTNGISQGSTLMDFIAEIVLGYIDSEINFALRDKTGFRILRYRDDYRIFANSDEQVEMLLKVVSEKLQLVGMKLGVTKTLLNRNVVEGSIKTDKLASIELQDLGIAHAKTIQKQLLRLHSFGQRFPNSGALRRLVSEFHTNIISNMNEKPDDLEVQIAIATDMGFVSPSSFPAVAAILSHLISFASIEEKHQLWASVRNKMKRVPHNGYLEIWLQRVTQTKAIDLPFDSDEPICKIVNGENPDIWENGWLENTDLKNALEVKNIRVGSVSETEEVIQPNEIELFKLKAIAY